MPCRRRGCSSGGGPGPGGLYLVIPAWLCGDRRAGRRSGHRAGLPGMHRRAADMLGRGMPQHSVDRAGAVFVWSSRSAVWAVRCSITFILTGRYAQWTVARSGPMDRATVQTRTTAGRLHCRSSRSKRSAPGSAQWVSSGRTLTPRLAVRAHHFPLGCGRSLLSGVPETHLAELLTGWPPWPVAVAVSRTARAGHRCRLRGAVRDRRRVRCRTTGPCAPVAGVPFAPRCPER
jgi:hypothetical protein